MHSHHSISLLRGYMSPGLARPPPETLAPKKWSGQFTCSFIMLSGATIARAARLEVCPTSLIVLT